VRRTAIALLVIASLGCTASLQDVRQQAPAFTGDFQQPYRTISWCIYDRLNSQTGSTPFTKGSLSGGLSHFIYRLEEEPDQRRARIDAMSVGGPPSAEFEISVEPAVSGTSRVEYRRRWGGFWGSDQAAWSVVMACGQPKT
jgi:hypothetical protein